MPIELVPQANENALGFSLTFDPAVLSNPRATLGSGASSASLNENRNQIGQGRLGLAIALPAGQTFAAGVRQIAIVTFTIASSATPGSSAPIGFANQPIASEVVGANATPLPAGRCTVVDWVQCGRFAAGLDNLSGSEFQRADCAPRETKGDGRLTISDWVLCGRCAAGLDPIQPSGGPTGPVSLAASPADAGETSAPAQGEPGRGRSLRAVSGTFRRGQINSLTIEFDAQGDENAAGFSLRYDPGLLVFASSETQTFQNREIPVVGAPSIQFLESQSGVNVSGSNVHFVLYDRSVRAKIPDIKLWRAAFAVMYTIPWEEKGMALR